MRGASLPVELFALAFRRERLGPTLAVLLGIMVFLGALAMAAQTVLARTSGAWQHDLQGRLTVEIPSARQEDPAQREGRAQKAAALLRASGLAVEVTVVPESEARKYLGPWVADESLLASLALPRLVDVEAAAGHKVETEKVQNLLKPLNADIRVHRNEQGMAELSGFLRALGALAWAMLGLTGISLVLIVRLICRAALAIQHETIELMHYMGASDDVLARLFQAYVRRWALPAALAGFGLAAAAVVLLYFLVRSLGGLSLVASVSWTVTGVAMAVVPAAAALLALATARLSVLRFLRRLV